jgi:L-aspartate oxidase
MADEQFDLIIVGSGVSGLSAAITAAESGAEVCVLSKEQDLYECNTFYAQGGIVGEGVDDSPELLKKDILRAGDRLNYHAAVDLLASDGPRTVTDFLLHKVGVPFCRHKTGELDLTREGAHSTRRILHVRDESGKAIELSLLNYAKKTANIEFRSNHFAVDLLTNSHHALDLQERYRETRVIGVYALNQNTGEVVSLFAPTIILATGGLGNLFLHTSNPEGAVGDGIAMAYRAGATILNAEYVQFHPTKLFHRDVKRFLISESLRGEGARLMTRRGEYFMEKYNPELKDLAPRDEVSRAIYREVELDQDAFVLLDTTAIDGISLKDRFPSIYTTCLEVGIDIEKEPIPVVPAAHYSCGGIKVDLKGRTTVKGLYALGETACTGVHGANRLASVSLLEGLFFGVRAGKHIGAKKKNLSQELLKKIPPWFYPENEIDFDPVLINQDLLNIRSLMWHYAGIVRTKRRLQRILADLNYLSHRIEQFYQEARLTKTIIELRNAVLTASLVAKAAYNNPDSRGCHYVRK